MPPSNKPKAPSKDVKVGSSVSKQAQPSNKGQQPSSQQPLSQRPSSSTKVARHSPRKIEIRSTKQQAHSGCSSKQPVRDTAQHEGQTQLPLSHEPTREELDPRTNPNLRIRDTETPVPKEHPSIEPATTSGGFNYPDEPPFPGIKQRGHGAHVSAIHEPIVEALSPRMNAKLPIRETETPVLVNPPSTRPVQRSSEVNDLSGLREQIIANYSFTDPNIDFDIVTQTKEGPAASFIAASVISETRTNRKEAVLSKGSTTHTGALGSLLQETAWKVSGILRLCEGPFRAESRTSSQGSIGDTNVALDACQGLLIKGMREQITANAKVCLTINDPDNAYTEDNVTILVHEVDIGVRDPAYVAAVFRTREQRFARCMTGKSSVSVTLALENLLMESAIKVNMLLEMGAPRTRSPSPNPRADNALPRITEAAQKLTDWAQKQSEGEAHSAPSGEGGSQLQHATTFSTGRLEQIAKQNQEAWYAAAQSEGESYAVTSDEDMPMLPIRKK